jgi:hypothetical protein
LPTAALAPLQDYLTSLTDVTSMVVSHDSGFLDAVCTDIVHYEKDKKLKHYKVRAACCPALRFPRQLAGSPRHDHAASQHMKATGRLCVSLLMAVKLCVTECFGLCCEHVRERIVLFAAQGNLSEFVKIRPEARAYYELGSASLKFTLPKPGFLDGIKGREVRFCAASLVIAQEELHLIANSCRPRAICAYNAHAP